ncbi:NrsF family protein [Hyphomicrobium sp.]|uniref:NrsF family protein n=1 Tax=Hyphomicrobium sp. TaxID=82 RepID=UPI002D79A032|nr:NrsF family protein [Hyphomicrobium sp.]HET6387851.1 NrsF family protein [Hyphomicrobium sp.]
MKTDDLINALAADAKSVERPIAQTVAIAVGVGALVSTLIFFWSLGLRANFAESAVSSLRFLFKYVLTFSLAIPAYVLVRGLSRPDFQPGNKLWWLALAPALLLSAMGLEMLAVPSDQWHAKMVGYNSLTCLVVIPLLSFAPLAAVLYALRQGAPANPALAGAIGGLLSASIAATLYASHCRDDSPLFLAAWYTIGFVLMTGIGALAGSRILRW